MTILGIETSCDETSVAIVEGKGDRVGIIANAVASSLAMHAKTGGIIPEIAARAQLKFMLPVLIEANERAFGISANNITSSPPPIDAIAVTYGPGLIGPLLIGVETARTLSFVWQKPVIPVNHMMGHIYANFISVTGNLSHKGTNFSEVSELRTKNKSVPEFPLIALVVSGQHTDLLYMKQHSDFTVLGGTRDDAAGEAFDKIGRLIGLSYPAGAMIEQRAKLGNEKRFHFPRPLLNEQTHDFSFSGLKTAVLREVLALHRNEKKGTFTDNRHGMGSFAKPQKDISLDEKTINDIAAGTQRAIVDVLVKKTLHAAEVVNAKSILLSGGVAANQLLRVAFQSEMQRQKIVAKLYYPPKNLCTDNAAMIAAAAYFNYKPIDWKKLTADPELYYD